MGVGRQERSNAAVKQISRPTCSGRDSPVGLASPRGLASPPEPVTPQQPHPQTFTTGGEEVGEGGGLEGYSRKTEGGLSYQCDWDIMTQSFRPCTQHEDRDTCTQEKP